MPSLPVPRTRIGWMFSLLLIIVSFFIYYFWVFDCISDKYYQNFWHTQPYDSQNNVSFELRVPAQLSPFVYRELLIRARNISDKTVGPFSMTLFAGTMKDGEFCPYLEDGQFAPVLFCFAPNNNSVGCNEGSNIIEFGELPAYGEIVRNVWVVGDSNWESIGRSQIFFGIWKNGYLLDNIVNDDPNITVTPVVIPTITPLRVLTATPDPANGALVSSPTPFPANSASENCIPTTNKPAVQFDSRMTFFQSFLGILLLPPWANGLIPALVLFVVYSNEHKIQRKEKKGSCPKFSIRKYCQSLWRWWVTGDSIDPTLVVCSQRCAFGLVTVLYFGLAITIFAVPLIFSDKTCWLFWLGLGLFGLVLFLGSKHLIGLCESTDLKDNDPIYRVEEPPAKPVEVEEKVKADLAQIANSVKELSSRRESAKGLTQKIESGFADLVSNLQEALRILGGSQNKSQTILEDIRQSLTNMGALLENLSKPQSTESPPSIVGYRFNFQSILVDPEALRLFVEALNSVSRPEFEKLKDNADFALRLLSLLAKPKDGADKVKIEGVALISILADSNAFKDVTVLEKWLKEAPVQYIPALMNWLLTKKRKLAEKFLFEIVLSRLSRCDVIQALPLLKK